RIGVLARDHLALLGQAQLPVDAAGRLGKHDPVAGAAPAPDSAAAAVEQAQADAVPPAGVDDRQLALVQLPVRRQEAAVLVAVRVAEHDLLRVAAALEQLA